MSGMHEMFNTVPIAMSVCVQGAQQRRTSSHLQCGAPLFAARELRFGTHIHQSYNRSNYVYIKINHSASRSCD